MDIDDLRLQLRQFAEDRDWDQFHTPKNLAMACVCEAGELAELFQWMTPEQSQMCMKDAATAEAVQDEIADVFIYLVRLSDKLNVDLFSAVRLKLERNADKYPVQVARGSAVKYSRREP